MMVISMLRRSTAVGVVAALAGLGQGGTADAQVIDRVLAVVGGDLILLSDLDAALRFGLVQAPAGAADPVAATLPALIERQLQVAEVNRFLPPEAPEATIKERVDAIRARFANAAAFDAALAETGLSAEQLRERVRDTLRVESYQRQRFAAALQPTEDDVARYYRAHAAEFTRDGVLASFEQARDEARRRLVAERSGTLFREWIEGLRRRAEVTILYQPGPRSAR